MRLVYAEALWLGVVWEGRLWGFDWYVVCVLG